MVSGSSLIQVITMRFIAIVAVFMTLASEAIAEENLIRQCQQWGWRREDSNGYLTTITYVCSGKGEDVVSLEMACGDAQTVWIGYNQKESGEDLPDSATFVFENQLDRQAVLFSYDQHEDLLATNTSKDGPLIAMLKRGQSFTLRQQGKENSTHEFTLAGAPGAIYALEIGCKPPVN